MSPRVAVAGELDVRAAGLDADRADDRDRRVAELLVGLVGEGHLRRDGDRVAGVDAHRVEVLDRADDDDVVAPVADHLELELVPALDRLLDEHLADRALAQAELDLGAQLRRGRDEAAAVAAERERGPDDRGHGDAGELVDRRDDPRLRHRQADALHRLAEELAVLGAADHVDGRAEQLDPERVEHALLGELDREVERRLAAERRQQRVGPLAAEHVRDALEVERLEVGGVGEAGVGHDRGRVRVDDDRAEAVLAQHLQRLAAGVVELARLPDHDRAGADQADRLDVVPTRHRGPPRPRSRGSARRRAGRGRPRGGTAPSGRAARGSRSPRRCRRRARRASPRRRREGATAKPWFWLVTSTRPLRRSSTGWLAPRWPNGSLNVSWPVARPSSWWPRQIPSTGTRPSRRSISRTSSPSGCGSPGPFESRTAS